MTAPDVSPESPSPSDASALKPAGFWIRFGAYLVDALIFLPISIAVGLLVSDPNQATIVEVAVFLIAALYKPLMEAHWGATLGKMALGLKVRAGDGGRVGLTAAFVRRLLEIVPGVVFLVYSYQMRMAGAETADPERAMEIFQAHLNLLLFGAGLYVVTLVAYIVVAFNPRKRGLHDMLADTIVVDKESLPTEVR